jgi:hypothetical protein
MGYKVKPPKCGFEFWRRERRIKKPYSEEIVRLKYEMSEIRNAIKAIHRVQEEGSAKSIELGLLMVGARANIKELTKVTTVSKEQKNEVRSRENKYFNNQTDRFWVIMGVHYLRELHRQKQLRCLVIRREQTENRRAIFCNEV